QVLCRARRPSVVRAGQPPPLLLGRPRLLLEGDARLRRRGVGLHLQRLLLLDAIDRQGDAVGPRGDRPAARRTALPLPPAPGGPCGPPRFQTTLCSPGSFGAGSSRTTRPPASSTFRLTCRAASASE